MKKKIIIICIVLSSVIFAFTDNSFIVSARDIIPFLFTLLGLCLTAYTFIYSPITEILKKNDKSNNIEKNKRLNRLLKSFEEDMLCIFFLTITIICIDFIKSLDIPLIKDITNINLRIISIISLKKFIVNFIISLSASLSFYALYDLMKATFKILRSSLDE